MLDRPSVHLRSLATALPPHAVSATDTKAFITWLGVRDVSRWINMVDGSGIRTRYSVVPVADIVRRHTLGERNAEYVRHASDLAAHVASRALAAAHVEATAVETVISVSCTGYMLPSLEAFLVSRLGLDARVRRIPITELGCSGGVAAVGIASSLLTAHPGSTILVLAVEPCSLCLQITEPTPDDVVGSILFGDGAAAAVLTSGRGVEHPAVLAAGSVLWPGTLDRLGMRLTSNGFHFVLSSGLPDIVRAQVRASVIDFLNANGFGLDDVRFWVVHPGGPKILDAVAHALGLTKADLRPAWHTLARCGNVSSATVFFILRELHASSPPPPGTLGMMIAFGPGVTCEMALLRSAGWLSESASRSEELPRAAHVLTDRPGSALP